MRRLRWISWLEGTTLLLLLVVAVPLKHAAGMPLAVSIMGPIHGVAFLLYLSALFRVVAMGGWDTTDVARMVLAAFIPFGAFINAPFMHRKARELTAHFA
ncbi:DUF3817 domain-containing protein [Kushneria aurantia]|uniref:DUF3817 domain-containing protein n=1 Tax=Kushneria aurantia TaxID=504092 RepID=A0ABV6G3C5_9GAMM|nr:DUF3817 domain-containing protein [Kushneria aurantia]